MKVIVTNHVGPYSARLLADQVRRKPSSVLGLATGGTPVATYRELIRLFARGEVSFSRVTAFNLDEYWPIDRNHPQSYAHFMRWNLFDAVDIRADACHIPDGEVSPDLIDEHCCSYETAIHKAGGIDLQLLGIGMNGHIGFNEPGSSFQSRARLVDLSGHTIAANARFFESKEDVPRQALTMGIETILAARRVLLLATGRFKAKAIHDALDEPVTEACPASVLQTHPHVTVVLDYQAASQLVAGRQKALRVSAV